MDAYGNKGTLILWRASLQHSLTKISFSPPWKVSKKSSQSWIFLKFIFSFFHVLGQKTTAVGASDRKSCSKIAWLLWSFGFWACNRGPGNFDWGSLWKYSTSSFLTSISRRWTGWGSHLGTIIIIQMCRYSDFQYILFVCLDVFLMEGEQVSLF